MRRSIVWLLGLVLGAWMAVAAQAAQEPVIRIVTTTTDLASLAQAVAGDLAVVKSICDGREDPHFLQAKPSYILLARDADLWIRVGMELEVGWELPVLEGARRGDLLPGQARHLDASERVLRLEKPGGHVHRGMGDVHPAGNPHYWLDPLNGRLVAVSIAQRLAQLYPAHAPEFARNLERFQGSLDQRMFGAELVERVGGGMLWALMIKGQLESHLKSLNPPAQPGGWLGRMQPLENTYLVTYHKSWTYLAERFGLLVVDQLEPQPGIPPSGSHLTQVIGRVKSRGVKLILLEPFYPRKAADLVAGQTGAKVVVAPNMVGGARTATDYLSLLDTIVAQLAEAQ